VEKLADTLRQTTWYGSTARCTGRVQRWGRE